MEMTMASVEFSEAQSLRARLAWRLRADRGAVGVLMALMMFFVCGMLTMTWNSYTLSRDKMRLQNAVDAAALEHAVWQARGMNCLQNLNDEAYDTLSTAVAGYYVSWALTGIAQAVTAIPFVGPILNGILIGASVIVTAACTWSVEVVLTFIKIAQKFYQYGSCAMGYISAQQIAALNGATGILGNINGKQSLLELKLPDATISLDLHAVGLSLSPKDTFVLPVEAKTLSTPPWDSQSLVIAPFAMWDAIPVIGKLYWHPQKMPTFAPVVSRTEGGKAKLPSPTFWVAIRGYPAYDSMGGFGKWFGSEMASPRKSAFPIMAYGVGQCVTGDIVESSSLKHPSRPKGFGVGATAKLISLEQALKQTGHTTLQKAAGILMYH